MNYINDIKWDGSRFHVSYWNDILKKRIFVGRFTDRLTAESARRNEVTKAKSIYR